MTLQLLLCYSSTASDGLFSSPCSPSRSDHHHHHNNQIINPNTFWQTHFLTYSSEQNPLLFSPQKKHSTLYTAIPDSASSKQEDIKLVFEVLLMKNKKRRNTVIVGDCFSAIEGLISELMGRVERGTDVPDELKQTRFIKFQFAPVTLRFMKKEDVEMNLNDLKRKVDALTSAGGGAIIYTGDLKWTVDQENFNGEISCYSPVNHLVAEIGRLVSDFITSNSKVWLLATASYQTYRRCQMKEPPLDTQWALQAVSVPSGGLGLSLHASSVHDSRLSFSQNPTPFTCKEEEEDKLSCCAECTSNYENESQLFKSGQQKLLPPWLQQSHATANSNQKDELVEMKRKWNRLCHSLHHGRHTGKSYSYASSYPWWPSQSSIFPDSNASISFAESGLNPNNSSHSVPKFRRQQSCSTIEFDFGNGGHKLQGGGPPNLDSLKSSGGKEVRITLALGNSVFSDSDENGRATAMQPDDLCKALQETVPWQCDAIPSMADFLIESKSTQKETWLLIQGNDTIGKRRLALAIAELVFGSSDLLFRVNMSKRDCDVIQLSEKLIQSLKNHENLVVLVENVHLADPKFMKFLADRFETGKFGESREEKSGQIIFILGEGDSCNYEDSVIPMTLKMNERIPSSDQKRKAEWDCPNKIKSPKFGEKEDASSIATAADNVINSSKKDFSRQSSFNTLDLNMKANEDDEIEAQTGELSPVSSDLTRETTTNPTTPNGFLDLIGNRFVFNRNSIEDGEVKGSFMSRFTECFEAVFGGEDGVNFSVEDRVLEGVFIGSSSFLNSLFDKWLKEVFQTSLNTVKFGGKDGICVIRLCFGGKIGNVTEGGYKGSCLPKNIQFSSMN